MKIRWKQAINAFIIIALLALIYVSREQVSDTFVELRGARFWLLVFVVPIQLANYFSYSMMYRSFFSFNRIKIKLMTMFRVVMELNFINNVLPSGGVSGFTYMAMRLKPMGVSTSQATLAQIIRFAMTFISFILLLLIGLVSLAAGNRINNIVIMTSSLIVMSLVFLIFVGIYIISGQSRINTFVAWAPRVMNAISSKFKKNKHKEQTFSADRINRGLIELHRDYVEVTRDRGLLLRLIGWSLSASICELMTIYLVYIVFGNFVNPGAIILAYAVASLAGLVSVLPGGVGVYESLMTGVLAASGVEKGLGLSTTVVYRVTSMTFGVSIGFILYQIAQRHSDVATISGIKAAE